MSDSQDWRRVPFTGDGHELIARPSSPLGHPGADSAVLGWSESATQDRVPIRLSTA